ncbi:MAG: hypothetical protein HYS80_01585 [Candidatus Aenigmarchaeota archaeon]|nr:hypothetical protein [Candidatus Aenigmarchaeota archaeon]
MSKEEIFTVIENIAKQEGGEINQALSAEVKDALHTVSEGDVRRVTNILQSCFTVKKEGEHLEAKDIYSMASAARPKEVQEILQRAFSGKFVESRKLLLDTMLNYGMSGVDVLKQIQKEIWNLQIDDRKKVELVDKCGEIEFRMVEGSDEYLQLESFLAFIALVGKK